MVVIQSPTAEKGEEKRKKEETAGVK